MTTLIASVEIQIPTDVISSAQTQIDALNDSLTTLEQHGSATSSSLATITPASAEASGGLGQLGQSAITTTAGMLGLDGATGAAVTSLGSIAGPAAAGAAALGVLAASVNTFNDEIGTLNRLSAAFDMDAESIKGLQMTFSDVGESGDKVTTIFQRLSMGISQAQVQIDAGKEPTGKFADGLKSIGVEATNADGSLRSVGDLMPDIMAAFGGVDQATQRFTSGVSASTAANDLFGRSGAQSVMALEQQGGAYLANVEKAKAFGDMSAENKQKYLDEQHALTDLSASFDHLEIVMGGAVVPALAKVAEGMTWLIDHGDSVKTTLEKEAIAAVPFGAALSLIADHFGLYKDSGDKAAATTTNVVSGMGDLSAYAPSAADGVGALGAKATEATGKLDSLNSSVKGAFDAVEKLFGVAVEATPQLGLLAGVFTEIGNAAEKIPTNIQQSTIAHKDNTEAVKDNTKELDLESQAVIAGIQGHADKAAMLRQEEAAYALNTTAGDANAASIARQISQLDAQDAALKTAATDQKQTTDQLAAAYNTEATAVASAKKQEQTAIQEADTAASAHAAALRAGDLSDVISKNAAGLASTLNTINQQEQAQRSSAEVSAITSQYAIQVLQEQAGQATTIAQKQAIDIKIVEAQKLEDLKQSEAAQTILIEDEEKKRLETLNTQLLQEQDAVQTAKSVELQITADVDTAKSNIDLATADITRQSAEDTANQVIATIEAVAVARGEDVSAAVAGAEAIMKANGTANDAAIKSDEQVIAANQAYIQTLTGSGGLADAWRQYEAAMGIAVTQTTADMGTVKSSATDAITSVGQAGAAAAATITGDANVAAAAIANLKSAAATSSGSGGSGSGGASGSHPFGSGFGQSPIGPGAPSNPTIGYNVGFFGGGGGGGSSSGFNPLGTAGGAASGGFAAGTNSAPGGWAMVGEQGPELVNLPAGSQVVPNNVLGGGGTWANSAAASSQDLHLHLQLSDIAQQLVPYVIQAIGSIGNMYTEGGVRSLLPAGV